MLNGRTALVVEEEFLIALDIQRMLETLGVGQTLFARTAAEAEHLRDSWPEIGLAIVEIRSHGTAAHELVDGLRRAGVPMVLTTSDLVMANGSRVFPDLTVLSKPLPEEAMTSAIQQALAARI
jgi:CheY-like chemotaxis protein